MRKGYSDFIYHLIGTGMIHSHEYDMHDGIVQERFSALYQMWLIIAADSFYVGFPIYGSSQTILPNFSSYLKHFTYSCVLC